MVVYMVPAPSTSTRAPASGSTGAAVAAAGELNKSLSKLMGDAPMCDQCGHMTVRNGSCYRCADRPSTIVTSCDVGAAITKIDQLPFSSPNAGYSAWQRSVSATNERLYVAGPEWSWNGGDGGRSVIQVVDIKDPNGKLVKGADIPIAGQIQSRWQMDEHQERDPRGYGLPRHQRLCGEHHGHHDHTEGELSW